MNWSELTQQLAGDTQERLRGLSHLEVRASQQNEVQGIGALQGSP